MKSGRDAPLLQEYSIVDPDLSRLQVKPNSVFTVCRSIFLPRPRQSGWGRELHADVGFLVPLRQSCLSRGYKAFFVLNSAEHEILNAHEDKKIKKFSFLQAQISRECYISAQKC